MSLVGCMIAHCSAPPLFIVPLPRIWVAESTTAQSMWPQRKCQAVCLSHHDAKAKLTAEEFEEEVTLMRDKCGNMTDIFLFQNVGEPITMVLSDDETKHLISSYTKTIL